MRATFLVLAACVACPFIGAADDSPVPAVVRKTVAGSAIHTPRPWIVVSGKVTVKDGHTLLFADGLEVPLEDGPELDQLGKIGDLFYLAGRQAKAFLEKLIGERNVKMYINAGSEEYRRGERLFGDCYVGDLNLGHELIKHGWAIADHSITSPMEIMAREERRGLWRGDFVLPSNWRKGERLPGEDAAISEEEKSALRQLGGRFQIENGHVATLALQGDEVNEPALANLKHLPHLISLSISDPPEGAAITDALLAPLAGLSQLATLRMSRVNGLTDAGLVHLQGLSQLAHLSITNTRSIDGSGLRHLRGLDRLEALDFNHTPIADAGLEQLKELTNLKSLGLRATKVTDRGLAHLAGLTNLEWLNLWETQTTDKGLAIVGKLPRIKRLGLVNSPITAAGLAHLKGLTGLEELQIRHVQGGDNAALAEIGKLTALRRLEFHQMQPTESGMAHLARLKDLEELRLVSSRIPDAGLAHLKGLSRLKSLNLWNVSITDAGLAHLATLTALEELYLSDTKITDAGLVHLEKLSSLTRLGLSGTEVTDAGLVHLMPLAKLRNVSLLHAPVTDKGVSKLKAAMPQLDVYYR